MNFVVRKLGEEGSPQRLSASCLERSVVHVSFFRDVDGIKGFHGGDARVKKVMPASKRSIGGQVEF